jgi:quinol monooxygenase YgiN
MDQANPRVIVAGYVKVAPRDREALVKVLQAHVPRVQSKDGCIAYTFAVDVMDPDMVRMSEAWRDRQSLERHLADDEFQAVQKQLVHIEFVGRSVQRYDVSSVTDI